MYMYVLHVSYVDELDEQVAIFFTRYLWLNSDIFAIIAPRHISQDSYAIAATRYLSLYLKYA